MVDQNSKTQNSDDVKVETEAENRAFRELDQERISKEIDTKADAKATEKVDQLKQDLAESLTGKKTERYEWEKKGKKAPSDYDELFNEVDKRIVKPDDVNEIVEKKLKEKEEDQLKRAEKERENQAKSLEDRKKQFDSEWYDLVKQGKLPAVSEEIQTKIDSKVVITPEEMEADPGLKARLGLVQIAQSTGKSAKLAYYEDYQKQPAGAKAPVFGGKPAAPQKTEDEWTYEEIKAEREERGW